MRTKKFVINFITDAFPILIISIIGIFKTKYFIQYLGTETLGLYQMFSQIMIYIALVDSGLTSAVLYSLYKPNVERNNKKLIELLSGAKKVFSLIGIIIFGIAFIVSFFVPYIIKDNNFQNNFVSLTFLLFATSSVIGYFFVPYNVLMEVKERKYVVNVCHQIGKIIQGLLEIGLLIYGVSFPLILLMHSIISLGANIIISVIANKKYKDLLIKSKERDLSFVKQIKHLIVHKINGLISFNIDVILITSFLGLKFVAIYSTYHFIINTVKTLIYKIESSVLAMIGNFMVKSKDKMYDLFNELLSFLYFMGTVICVPLLFAINGFIDLFYEGTIKTTNIVAIAFVSYLFIATVKLAVNIFSGASGLFKETKKSTYFDMTINLVVSIVLIKFIGIAGAVFGTGFALIISDLIVKAKIVHKHVFNENMKLYIVKNIKLLLIFFIDLAFGFLIFNYIKIDNLLNWFIIFGIFSIVNAIIIFGIYYLLKEIKFFERFKNLIKRRKK